MILPVLPVVQLLGRPLLRTNITNFVKRSLAQVNLRIITPWYRRRYVVSINRCRRLHLDTVSSSF
jgi:hypothetical protein